MAAPQPPVGLIIGITGLMGSGKTAAAEHLAAEHGFGHIRYSHVLADWYKEDPDRKSGLQVVGWEVMSGGLQAELNKRLISKMTPDRDWVVEGLRHRLDYEALKNTFASNFHLVYIDSPQQSRWLRLQKISRFRTLEEFMTADSHPVEQQIPALKELAELCIASGHPLQQLYGPLNQLVASLRKGNL